MSTICACMQTPIPVCAGHTVPMCARLALLVHCVGACMHVSSPFPMCHPHPLYGGMQDWMYLHTECLEITIELHNIKWPPPALVSAVQCRCSKEGGVAPRVGGISVGCVVLHFVATPGRLWLCLSGCAAAVHRASRARCACVTAWTCLRARAPHTHTCTHMHTHAHTHAHTHTCRQYVPHTHACTHARTHA